MKKTILFLFSIFGIIWLLVTPKLAYAHFPATDGNITTILHVDPNDAPVPGEEAIIYLDFGDVTNKFRLENCNCSLSIAEQGKIIFSQKIISQKLTSPSIYNAGVPYIFPNRDIYHITVTGKPITNNAFQPFTVAWDFRVDNYPNASNTVNPLAAVSFYLYIAAGVIILFLAIYGIGILIDKKKKK